MNSNPKQKVPSRLAVKVTRALQNENGRRLLAGEEFLTQDEIALLIDRETGNLLKVEAGPTDNYQTDEKSFDVWFEKQRYSFGAMPNWTQIAEMKRVWCIARNSLREAGPIVRIL